MAKNDPRIITARFGNCAKCQRNIKGKNVYYWPIDKKVYCLDCGQSDYEFFLNSKVDEENYNLQY